jgi:hypothetical protein
MKLNEIKLVINSKKIIRKYLIKRPLKLKFGKTFLKAAIKSKLIC